MTDIADLKAGLPATTEKTPDPVVAALMKATNAMRAVLPRHITPERMSRMALGVLRTNKKLAEVAHKNPHSFAHSVVQASQLGLEIGTFGEAHLVPFGDEIALIPGYQGLVKLAKNSGMVVDIYAHEVRTSDKFKLQYGMTRDLQHEPLSDGGFPASDEKRGAIVGFYAVAVYKDGTRTFIAMGVAEINKVRDDSRGYQAAKKYKKEHPWDTHFEAMGRKTVVRRLCNWLPKSPEMMMALDIDTAADRGKRANIEGDFVLVEDGDEEAGGTDATGNDGAIAGKGARAGRGQARGAAAAGGEEKTNGGHAPVVGAEQSQKGAGAPSGAGAEAGKAAGSPAPRFGAILKSLRAAQTVEEIYAAMDVIRNNPNLAASEIELLEDEEKEMREKLSKAAPQPASATGGARRAVE